MKKLFLFSTILCLNHFLFAQCDSTQITNQECICSIYLVNIFTPNNDGLNDYFEFNSNCELSNNYNLKIFNRFGELIYETNDFDQKWDGYYKGQICSAGLYACVINFQFKYLKAKQIKGRRLTLKI